MKKEKPLWFILNSIFLVTFNALFFIWGDTERNASVWISYGFIHFAYLMLLFTPKLVHANQNAAVFGYPLFYLSSVYFLVELVIGTIFILINQDSYKTALSIQLVCASMYGILLVSNLIANKRTVAAIEGQQQQISYIKEASGKIKVLMEFVNDKEARKRVERVYDALYSSPVKSYHVLEQIEARILASINELEKAVLAKNKDTTISLADTLLVAINERNIQHKML
jgi:signal transduction histidine kinase